MSDLMKYLFEYSYGRKDESKRLRESWKNIDDSIKKFVQPENRDAMDSVINEHSSEMRYRGFLDGFWLATKLWKDVF